MQIFVAIFPPFLTMFTAALSHKVTSHSSHIQRISSPFVVILKWRLLADFTVESTKDSLCFGFRCIFPSVLSSVSTRSLAVVLTLICIPPPTTTPSLRDTSGIADFKFQLDEAFDDATGPPWTHLEDVDEPVETSTSPRGNIIINTPLSVPRMQRSMRMFSMRPEEEEDYRPLPN